MHLSSLFCTVFVTTALHPSGALSRACAYKKAGGCYTPGLGIELYARDP